MSEKSSPNDSAAPEPTDPSPQERTGGLTAGRRSWARRLAITGAGLLGVLLILVYLLPVLLSSRPVRGYLVERVNRHLAGRVEIDAIDLRWTAGMGVRGVRLFDRADRLLVEANLLMPDRGLWALLLDRDDFGQVFVDVTQLQLDLNVDGTPDLSRVLKPAKPKDPRDRRGRDEPFELPELRGTLAIHFARGTLQGPGLRGPLTLMRRSKISVSLDGESGPLELLTDIGFAAETGPLNRVQLRTTLRPDDKRRLDPATMTASLRLEIENLNPAVALPVLRHHLGDDFEYAGVIGGNLSVDYAADGLTAEGLLTVFSPHLTGGAIGRDYYSAESLQVPVQLNTQADTLIIRRLDLLSDDFRLNTAGQIPMQAVRNILARRPPAKSGTLSLTAELPDLPRLVSKLPRTFGLEPGQSVRLQSATTRVQVNVDETHLDAQLTLNGRGEVDTDLLTADLKVARFDPVRRSVGQVALNASSPDLPAASKLIGPLLTRAGLSIDGGQLYLNGAASFDPTNDTWQITRPLELTTPGLTVGINDGRGKRWLLRRERIALLLDGQFTTGQDGQWQLDARQLRLDSSSGMIRVSIPAGRSVIVRALPDRIEADGELDYAADLEPLLRLYAALTAQPPPPYTGQITGRQSLQSRGQQTVLTGLTDLTDLTVRDPDDLTRTLVREPLVRLTNDLTIEGLGQDLNFRQLRLHTPDSGAISIDARGRVLDPTDARRLELAVVEVEYDLEKLWPVLRPLAGDALKTASFSGRHRTVIPLTGSIPASDDEGKPLPWRKSIRSLTANGNLAVPQAKLLDVNLEELILFFDLRQGILRTSSRPARASGGTLDLPRLALDLTGDQPRLSSPDRNKRTLIQVGINPLLGDRLGRYLNPVFPNSRRAEGKLDLTIQYLDNVALGEAITTADSGRARIAMSLSDMHIVNPTGSLMVGALLRDIPFAQGFTPDRADVFQGQIRDAVVTLEAGRTTQDITLTLVDRSRQGPDGQPLTMPLAFRGDIRLSDLQQQLDVRLPSPLITRYIRSDAVERFLGRTFPQGIPVRLGGTVLQPTVDPGDFAQRLIEAQVRDAIPIPGAENFLDRLRRPQR